MSVTTDAWNTVLDKIKDEVTSANFDTWFTNTYIANSEDGVVFIGAPNEFVREWLQQKYLKLIIRNLRLVHNEIRSAEIIVAKKKDKNRPAQPINTRSSMFMTNSSPLFTGADMVDVKDGLNPRYTFDNFVIGSFNELAYSASQAIIQNPGAYNPLFIYGDSGLGKTHLIQAVGNEIKKEDSSIKILYTNSERYTNDFVSAMQNKRINSFKERYRKYDVFIMDDIQFLSNKEKTQEELFHLFNVLYDMNKQIIFSSDKHPNFIVGLENRLKSRFSAGMITNVTKPEYTERVALLKMKCRTSDYVMPEDVIKYIASNVEGNVRELEGIFNSLSCHHRPTNKDLSIDAVRKFIKNNANLKKNVPVSEIIRVIADYYNVDESLVYEKTRVKEVVRSRQVAMYILRSDYTISFPSIGREMGGRDHTTVIHSCSRVGRKLNEDPILGQDIENIRQILQTL